MIISLRLVVLFELRELYSKPPLPSINPQTAYCYENNFLPCCPVALPQNPHDPEYLSNPPHLVLVLIAASSSALPASRAPRVEEHQAERGEVGEDAQQVDDVHAALDEPGHHGQ